MPWYSPNDTRITGTLERLNGEAEISGISKTGEPIYSGGTDIFWDDQETATDETGKVIFLDEHGDPWTFDELVEREEDT